MEGNAMDQTPENCDKVAKRIVNNMLLDDLKGLATYQLSLEMQKREDIFDMNSKLSVCKGLK
jgi:hypothetical protein